MTRVLREIGIVECHETADVFEIEAKIAGLIKSDGITIVFCDGGNKVKELEVFSKYIKKEDFIAVHDWGTEVLPTDVPKELKLVRQGVMTAIFRHA